MGEPEHDLDPKLRAAIREKVRALPALTAEQLKALGQTVASIRIRTGR